MSAQVSITQLPAAGAITGSESVPIVQNGVTVRTTTGAIAASPSQTQTFLTVNQEPTLANSRYFGATNGLTITDGGAQGPFNVTTTGALLSLVNSGTGFQVKTSSTALTTRSIATSGAGLTISNGNGISGDPTISLTGQTSNFANASFNGLVTLSTSGAITSSVITGTSSQIDVTNGSGVSGNPTISISNDPTLPGSAGVILPSGTTGQRSGSPTNGTLRYNTTVALLEAYLNGTWTSLASGSGVTSILTGTGLTGGPITSTGTISLANTAVTAGTYGTDARSTTFTVNAQGQLTNVFDQPISIPASAINTTIPNTGLTNSSVTIGTTSVALGATTLTLGGLTSVAVTADPTTAFQLTTKQYVDGLVSTGLAYHQPVQAATTASLASTTGGTVTYNNGTAGVGATITLSVALTVLDGYTLANTDRILVKNEVNQAYNGVYTWATGGTVLTRATDADTYGTGINQLSQNDYFFTQNGTVNKGTSYVVTTVGTITFGTTAITFAEFSSSLVYTGSSPIQVSGTVISLNTVPVASGGTNITSYATGDMLYASGSTTLSKLTLGTNGYVLTAGASAPAYVAQSTLSVGTATNIAGGAAGSVPYNTGSGITSFLALGTSGYVLTAGASAPAYVAQSTLSVGSATNTGTTASSAAATHYLVFKSATSGDLPELVNSAISVYPSTGVITSGISGGTF
jgi:hypothetical protein